MDTFGINECSLTHKTEWVQKIHFENRVDRKFMGAHWSFIIKVYWIRCILVVNLQVPTAGESMKIEIDGIPSKVDAKTSSFSLDDLSPLQ